jgi:hypothetical protein
VDGSRGRVGSGGAGKAADVGGPFLPVPREKERVINGAVRAALCFCPRAWLDEPTSHLGWRKRRLSATLSLPRRRASWPLEQKGGRRIGELGASAARFSESGKPNLRVGACTLLVASIDLELLPHS